MKTVFKEVLFLTGLSFLICHELDAVAQAEWRLLPVLNLLTDETASVVFILLHIPLIVLILWLVFHGKEMIKFRSRIAVDAFLVIHAGLHWLLSGEALYTFHSSLSEFLIFGGAVVGGAHLLSELRARQA